MEELLVDVNISYFKDHMELIISSDNVPPTERLRRSHYVVIHSFIIELILSLTSL